MTCEYLARDNLHSTPCILSNYLLRYGNRRFVHNYDHLNLDTRCKLKMTMYTFQQEPRAEVQAQDDI